MKQERNIITMDEYGRIHFPSTTNNDIWMNTDELIEQSKEQSVVNFISFLGESHYTARYVFSHSK